MVKQRFKNYPTIFPFGALFTLFMLIAGLVLTGINVFRNRQGNLLIEIGILVVFLVLGLMYYCSRLVALKARNWAIIAQEELRHTLLTGKPLDSRLQPNQIMALHLATNEELPSLAHLSAEKGLSCSEIKKYLNKRNK